MCKPSRSWVFNVVIFVKQTIGFDSWPFSQLQVYCCTAIKSRDHFENCLVVRGATSSDFSHPKGNFIALRNGQIELMIYVGVCEMSVLVTLKSNFAFWIAVAIPDCTSFHMCRMYSLVRRIKLANSFLTFVWMEEKDWASRRSLSFLLGGKHVRCAQTVHFWPRS